MGYTKTTWVDHIKDNSGLVVQQGTPVNAVRLNNIESGIEGATGIKNHVANKSYAIDDVVYFSGKIYRCKTSHTSVTNFNYSYWDIIGSSGSIANYALSTVYKVNDVVIRDRILYRVTVNYTSGADVDAFKSDVSSGRLEQLAKFASGIQAWSTSVHGGIFRVNDIVLHSNIIYKCVTEHTASSSFEPGVSVVWASISAGINDSADSTAATTTYSAKKMHETFIKGGIKITVSQTQPSQPSFGDLWIQLPE